MASRRSRVRIPSLTPHARERAEGCGGGSCRAGAVRRVAHPPRAGEVVHARDPFEEPAGGGSCRSGPACPARRRGHACYGARQGRAGATLDRAPARAERACAVRLDGPAHSRRHHAGRRSGRAHDHHLRRSPGPRRGRFKNPWSELSEMDAVYFDGWRPGCPACRAGCASARGQPACSSRPGPWDPTGCPGVERGRCHRASRGWKGTGGRGTGDLHPGCPWRDLQDSRWAGGRWEPSLLPGPGADSTAAGTLLPRVLPMALVPALPCRRR